ncbi:MAG: hypothetical protein AB8G11_25445 [Saprospiraceae bacterium]
MKKINVFVFSLILITFSNCSIVHYWQSSNATWEETVTFIDNHKNHITTLYASRLDYENNAKTIETIVLEDNIMVIKIKQNDSNEAVLSFKIPLKNINSVEEYGNFFRISSHGSYFNQYLDLELTQSYEELTLQSMDYEMFPRLYKAFSHIATLATKKRQQDRKDKKEKF